jgi:hypothetical protein
MLLVILAKQIRKSKSLIWHFGIYTKLSVADCEALSAREKLGNCDGEGLELCLKDHWIVDFFVG